MLNTSNLNTLPINLEFGVLAGYGTAAHILGVTEGAAESGPFSQDGNCVHIAFQFDGEAITPSLLAGVASHELQQSSGTIQALSYLYGVDSHPVQSCSGLATVGSTAIGTSSHILQRSTSVAVSSEFGYGAVDAYIQTCSGGAYTADVSIQGACIHPYQVSEGMASSATEADVYLDFERDTIIAPTIPTTPSFTILEFERL